MWIFKELYLFQLSDLSNCVAIRWDIKKEVWGEEGEESVPMLLAERNGGWESEVSDSEEEILVHSKPLEDGTNIVTTGSNANFVNIAIES